MGNDGGYEWEICTICCNLDLGSFLDVLVINRISAFCLLDVGFTFGGWGILLV